MSRLLPDYSVPEGHFDELRAPDGTLRPEWNTFASSEKDLSTASCAQANQRIARQIDENGVTYNVYATDRGAARPWALDVLPMVIPSLEWVDARARSSPASEAPEQRRRGSLRIADAGPGRPHSTRARLQAPGIPPRVPRGQAAERHLPARGGVRSGARARRTMARRRHARAGALRARVRARESRHRVAAVSRCVPFAGHSTARAVLPPAEGDAVCRRHRRVAAFPTSCC